MRSGVSSYGRGKRGLHRRRGGGWSLVPLRRCCRRPRSEVVLHSQLILAARAAESETLITNPIIYAEVSVGFARIEDLDAALPTTFCRRDALPDVLPDGAGHRAVVGIVAGSLLRRQRCHFVWRGRCCGTSGPR